MAKTIEALYTVDDTPEAVAQRAAAYFQARIAEAVAARGKARIAVSGGSTPKRTFELMAASPFRDRIQWDKLELYWVDERVVPPTDPDSNYRMTRLALLDKVPMKDSQIFRIPGELAPEEAAAKYESSIRNSFRLEGAELPTFDALALGMGPDGHTASLFPHTEALHELMRIAVANNVVMQKEAWRVTLTSPVINQARDVFFIVAGTDKASPLKSVLLGPYQPEEFPSQLIQPKSGRITFLLDASAAALLPAPGADATGRLEIQR